MISIITVVNNYDIYETWLKASLDIQEKIQYELIVVDNCHNTYKSLNQAYYKGIQKAKGEWLLFVHPDVKFIKKDSLYTLLQKVENYQNYNKSIHIWGVAGVEGGAFNTKKYVSTISHGVPPKKIKKSLEGRKYVIVQTIDACCFIIKRNIFNLYGFSNEYKGYHMLIEDLCIRINKKGNCCAVIPIELWHRSNGNSLDYLYFKNAIKLLKANPEIEFFNTTTIHGKNNSYYIFKLRCHQAKQLLICSAKCIINKTKKFLEEKHGNF